MFLQVIQIFQLIFLYVDRKIFSKQLVTDLLIFQHNLILLRYSIICLKISGVLKLIIITKILAYQITFQLIDHRLPIISFPAVFGLSLYTLFILPNLSVRYILSRDISLTLSLSTFLLFLHYRAFYKTFLSFSVIPFSSPRFFYENFTAF